MANKASYGDKEKIVVKVGDEYPIAEGYDFRGELLQAIKASCRTPTPSLQPWRRWLLSSLASPSRRKAVQHERRIAGQIDRTGLVCFGDASVSIWEEGIKSARDAGGPKGAEDWERQFKKREVFARVIQMLNRLGWTCTLPEIKPTTSNTTAATSRAGLLRESGPRQG